LTIKGISGDQREADGVESGAIYNHVDSRISSMITINENKNKFTFRNVTQHRISKYFNFISI